MHIELLTMLNAEQTKNSQKAQQGEAAAAARPMLRDSVAATLPVYLLLQLDLHLALFNLNVMS